MSSPPSGADPDGVANVSVTDAVGECGAMNGPTIATSTTKPAIASPILPRRLRAARPRITSHSGRELIPLVLGAGVIAPMSSHRVALRRGLASSAMTSVVMFTNT